MRNVSQHMNVLHMNGFKIATFIKQIYNDGYQVGAKVYILEHPLLEVHSMSLEQTHYMDRPERSG